MYVRMLCYYRLFGLLYISFVYIKASNCFYCYCVVPVVVVLNYLTLMLQDNENITDTVVGY